MSAPRPLPSPVGAAMMTLLAFVLVLFGWLVFAPDTGHALGLGLGLCLGFGGVGTLAARAVPPPADERLGLRGFPLRLLLPILLLLPSSVLASELDNLVRPLFPALPVPQETGAPSAEVLRLATVEFAIATALLRPVLEEFFFRGVVQQGVVAHLGAPGGVAYTAVLFGLASAGLELPFGPDRAASAGVQAAFLGLVLGLLRHATGSLLAPILASCLLHGLGIASVAVFARAFPIPGFNAPGEHTPPAVLATCVASLALAAAALRKGTDLRVKKLPPAPPASGRDPR